MKIDALHLTAFGPFTNTCLDFSGAGSSLHLVYGPNEAGKSSALRALRALFYGIDERSPDSFIHPYAKMRVGATLCADNGQRLDVVRRKGRTKTLRGADDQTVVEENVLAGFLNRVDADVFATMFGIGYDDLVAGGRQIVSGGGDLGQLVFSAGSGIVRLKEIRDALQAEAENLFKPSGKNPAINAALLQLKDIEKQLQQTMLPGTQWTGLEKEYQMARENRQRIEAKLRENQKARHHLDRIRQALPVIARRQEVTDLLAQYENAPVLASDFAETRRDLVSKLDMARREAERADAAISTIEKEMAGLLPDDTIINSAGLIEELYQQLGSQHKAAADRVGLDTRRSALLGECREILRSLSDELSLEDAEHLRIKKEQAAAIRRLSSEYEQITTRMESAKEALPEITREIRHLEEQKQQLSALRDPQSITVLEAVLTEALEYAPLEKQNKQDLAGMDTRRAGLENRMQQMGLSGKTAGELQQLPVPAIETIQVYEDSFAQAETRSQEMARECKQIDEQIRDTATRIKAGQMAQAVASESDLNTARARRDQGWQIVRTRLEGGSPDEQELSEYLGLSGNCTILADSFEYHVKTADDLADRLRREADRVAEHARLTADHQAAQNRRAELDAAYKQAQEELEKLHGQWERLWAETGISPKTPREMERWARDFMAVKNDLSEFEQVCAKARDLQNQTETRRASLAEQLKQLDPQTDFFSLTLSRLVFQARKIIEDEKNLAAEHEKIASEAAARKKELAAAKNRFETGKKAFEKWRASWAAAVSSLGLSADARPAEAEAVMEDVRTLFEKRKNAETLQKRIQGIDRDAEAFSGKVSALADAVASDLSGNAAEDIVLQLQARLTRAREDRTRKNTLEKQLSAEKKNLETARKNTQSLQASLWRMCEEAGCTNYLELPEAEQRSEKRRQFETELTSLEQRILELSGGATVEQFTAAAGAVDADTIEPEISRYDEKIAELTKQKDSLTETLGSLGNEMSKMDGSAKAAELAQQRQEILGRLDPDARHYARVRIATRVLDRAIDRFREKNQDPMLFRASELFAKITCGAFSGMRPEFDDSDRPVITGVRGTDHESVPVWAMSDGTADQLYLSLRLAGLEMTMEKSSPMPFIVDDILIKFDNNRAAAALEILADLSARTQVIFFTHHAHLIDLARQSLPDDRVVYHQL
jgi:uncharacterized protein YhaN